MTSGKPITIERKKRPDGSGLYGSYYRLSKQIGIKVLHYYGSGSDTEAQLRKSRAWKEAIREAKLLARAYSSKIVPKCYGVVAVKCYAEDDNSWVFRAGIVMQHIDGELLDRCNYDESRCEAILMRLHEKLLEHGLEMEDLHEGNVIVTGQQRKKYWAIDFSPELVIVKRSRR